MILTLCLPLLFIYSNLLAARYLISRLHATWAARHTVSVRQRSALIGETLPLCILLSAFCPKETICRYTRKSEIWIYRGRNITKLIPFAPALWV
jgi:hypothetical protein